MSITQRIEVYLVAGSLTEEATLHYTSKTLVAEILGLQEFHQKCQYEKM